MDIYYAELIGILLGDGCIGIYHSKVKGKYKTQYRIKVTLNSIKDLEYSEYVSFLFEKVFNKKPKIKPRKNENALDIYLLGKESVNFLLELGLVLSPKWGRATIPEKFLNFPLNTLVIRGYMDTDGCVCNVNNNGIRYPRIEMKVCPSPMQEQFIEILASLGFDPKIRRLDKGKICIVLSGMRKLKKWNETIGFSNKRNLNVANYFLKKNT